MSDWNQFAIKLWDSFKDSWSSYLEMHNLFFKPQCIYHIHCLETNFHKGWAYQTLKLASERATERQAAVTHMNNSNFRGATSTKLLAKTQIKLSEIPVMDRGFIQGSVLRSCRVFHKNCWNFQANYLSMLWNSDVKSVNLTVKILVDYSFRLWIY